MTATAPEFAVDDFPSGWSSVRPSAYGTNGALFRCGAGAAVGGKAIPVPAMEGKRIGWQPLLASNAAGFAGDNFTLLGSLGPDGFVRRLRAYAARRSWTSSLCLAYRAMVIATAQGLQYERGAQCFRVIGRMGSIGFGGELVERPFNAPLGAAFEVCIYLGGAGGQRRIYLFGTGFLWTDTLADLAPTYWLTWLRCPVVGPAGGPM